MRKVNALIFSIICLIVSSQAQSIKNIDPYVALQFNVGITLGQMRSAPVNINGQRYLLLIYSEEQSVDPFEGSFFFPKNTIKLALYDFKGNQKWKKELPNVVPGTWFLPVMPFDLDNNGKDEIFLVNTNDARKPFNYDGYVLQRLDPENGNVTGEWPWSKPSHNQANSYKWRFFIVGGYVNKTPVLLTIQGTYRDMRLQAWNQDMSPRWNKVYPDNFDGPRGSHMTPIIDTNNDGIEEVLIGERCIEFNKGEELFVLDGKKWNDHSDVVQPVWNTKDSKWYYWTCREKGEDVPRPRAVFFDEKGNSIWGVSQTKGHFHRGWIANIGPKGQKLAMASRYAIDKQKAITYGGKEFECWVYDAFTGKEVSVPFNPMGSPLDFNGDGIHEILVKGEIVDNTGKSWGNIGDQASIITTNKITNLPGEQIIAYYPDGTVKLWADKNGFDIPETKLAFSSKYYQRNVQMSGVGYMYRFLITCF